MKIPTGATLSAPGTPPVGSATIDSEGVGNFQPELLGIACQIQHATESGKGRTDDPGLLGTGLVMTPIGPMTIIQVKHADGTSMGAIMTPDEFVSFFDCMWQTKGLLVAASGREGQG